MCSRLGLAVLVTVIWLSPALAGERTWTSTDGRTMRAEFIREMDGEVTLLKGGKIVTLPLARLSDRDQQIVRDLAAGKPVPEEAPPPAPAAPAASPPAEPAAPAPRPAAPVGGASEPPSPKPLVKKPLPIENRTWTDIHGNQITGKYVRINGANVVLLRGGKTVSVPFYELSSEDQEYLRELLTSRGHEGLIPPRVNNESSLPEATNVPEGDGSRFPQPAGGAPPGISGPAGIPSGGPSFPGPGPGNFPPAGAGAGSFPPAGSSPGGISPPGAGPPGFGPGASPPGLTPPGAGAPGLPASGLPSTTPPGFPGSGAGIPGSTPAMPGSGSGFPTSPAMPGSGFPGSTPGFPASPSGAGSSPADRFHEQMERSRQERLDSLQQMQDRMQQRHESLFNRKTGECLNCNRKLNDAEMRGTSCPYCGVTWDYEVDEFGNKRDLNNSSISSPFAADHNAGGGANQKIDAKTARVIGLVIGGLIGFAVVVGMIIGTVYIIMSIASASSSSQQQMYR